MDRFVGHFGLHLADKSDDELLELEDDDPLDDDELLDEDDELLELDDELDELPDDDEELELDEDDDELLDEDDELLELDDELLDELDELVLDELLDTADELDESLLDEELLELSSGSTTVMQESNWVAPTPAIPPVSRRRNCLRSS